MPRRTRVLLAAGLLSPRSAWRRCCPTPAHRKGTMGTTARWRPWLSRPTRPSRLPRLPSRPVGARSPRGCAGRSSGSSRPAARSGPDSARVTTATLVDTQVRCAVFSASATASASAGPTSTQAAGPRAGGRRRGARRRAPTTASSTTGDLDLLATLRAAAAARPEPARVAKPSAPSSPRPPPRSPRSGCCATSSRASRCRPASSTTTPRRGADRGRARARSRRRRAGVYPRRAKVMTRGPRPIAQSHSWWCGPAAMQTIAWGWRHKTGEPPSRWARTASAPPPTAKRRHRHRAAWSTASTGYDSPRRAGPYVVLDISGLAYTPVVPAGLKTAHRRLPRPARAAPSRCSPASTRTSSD